MRWGFTAGSRARSCPRNIHQLHSPSTQTKLCWPCQTETRKLSNYRDIYPVLSLYSGAKPASFPESLCMLLNIPACKILDEDTWSWVLPTSRQHSSRTGLFLLKSPLDHQTSVLISPSSSFPQIFLPVKETQLLFILSSMSSSFVASSSWPSLSYYVCLCFMAAWCLVHFLCLCVCSCMCAVCSCMCTPVYSCLCICVYMHVWVHTCLHTYVYVHTCVSTPVHVCLWEGCMHIYVYVCESVCKYVHICAHLCVGVFMGIHNCEWVWTTSGVSPCLQHCLKMVSPAQHCVCQDNWFMSFQRVLCLHPTPPGEVNHRCPPVGRMFCLTSQLPYNHTKT